MTITITPQIILFAVIAIAAIQIAQRGVDYGIDRFLDWWEDWRDETRAFRELSGQSIEDATDDPETADEPYTPTAPPGIPFAITADTLHTTDCEHATDVLGLVYCPNVEDARAKAETLQLDVCEHCNLTTSPSSDSERVKALAT